MFEDEIKNRVPVLLALSTCPRCIRMKKFLSSHNVSIRIVDVDLLPIEERRKIYRFMEPVNPQISFPTIIVGELAVIGEDYDGAKEVLGL